MNSIKQWYIRNQVQVAWFIIGWLSLDLLYSFSRGNYTSMAIDAVLIALNYSLNKQSV